MGNKEGSFSGEEKWKWKGSKRKNIRLKNGKKKEDRNGAGRRKREGIYVLSAFLASYF